jgi:hypothetical protein
MEQHNARVSVLCTLLVETCHLHACFCCAEATAANPKELTEGLAASTYETKTRGQRKQGPARAAGEGSYVIAKGGSKGGVHLGYVLELPAEAGQAQQVLGIQQQGSFVLRWGGRGMLQLLAS